MASVYNGSYLVYLISGLYTGRAGRMKCYSGPARSSDFGVLGATAYLGASGQLRQAKRLDRGRLGISLGLILYRS